MNSQFLSWLIDQFNVILRPLNSALASPAEFASLMLQYGWDVDPTSFAMSDVEASLSIASDLTTVTQLIGAIWDPTSTSESSLDQYTKLVTTFADIISQLRDLTSSQAPSGIPAAAWSDFAASLLDGLLEDYLETSLPSLASFLIMTGVITKTPMTLTGTAGRTSYVKKSIAWDELASALTAPDAAVQHALSWNQTSNDFDFAQLLDRLSAALPLLGANATLQPPSAALLGTYYDSSSPSASSVMELQLSLLRAIDPSSGGVAFDFSVSVLPIPPKGQPDQSPAGISIGPAITMPSGVPAAGLGFFQLGLVGAFQADGGIRVDIWPGVVAVTLGAGSGQTTLAEELDIARILAPPTVLLGSWGSNRLQLADWELALKAAGTLAAPEFRADLSLTDLALIVDTGDADGFLQQVLGSGQLELDFDLDVFWSSRSGFGFEGQASLAISIPLHVDILGVIQLDTAYISIAAGGAGVAAVTLAISGGIQLGPLSASVEKLGVSAQITSASSMQPPGKFGNADFSFGFKPPDGLGIEVDATAVSGGGFVSFDSTQFQYAGGLELTIEMLQLKAFGLLNTQPEVSFVIIISADFPPITLGFGFFLSGVGGLLGVNRSMAIDPLRAAFRAHTIDDIVFLQGDLASQAPTLVEGIAAIFPPLDSHFVIGPFVTITWGDPALLTAELGLIISLPDPVTLAILGAIIVGVPDPDTPLILLNLDVLGTWDCDAKKIEIDASLYNSYIAAFTIQGDSAFLLNYGESPSFALSVGGLNPQFQPPPGFPTLAAMAINLGNGGNPGIGVLGYFAVTSNSVQHGAKAHLTATASGFGVDGHLGYDILIVFNPFGFMIDLHAELDVLAGGGVLMSIHLDGMLSGPSPWHIHGDAGFSILFFSVSVNIDATFGQSATSQNPPSVSTYTPFNTALQDYRNWSATLPPDAGRVATLAAAPASAACIVVHPLGAISFQQTVVPLNLQISKFGNAVPSDGTLFTVTGVELNGTASPLSSANTVTGEFADGQFIAMSDQDKISKPSYTSHASGAVFTSGTILAPFSIETDVAYQTFVEDDLVAGPQPGSPYQPYQSTVLALSANGASARSPRRQATAQRYITPGLTSAIGVNTELYLVVSALNNNPRVDIVPTPAGYYKVEAALSTYLGSNPGEAQTLQILAAYELQEAA